MYTHIHRHMTCPFVLAQVVELFWSACIRTSDSALPATGLQKCPPRRRY